ncbi:MAG: CoB--CoM heterodisulfide reductase iron-sulfur subunit B family protein [Deltaproteobacteria bacterium]|jgi:heterodisulfide reductase subunit B|nr:CoB--CoM heterodisulfide reductase iron-sulfur subunit B family protein [Deltaproteobacteria bacterium]
MKLSFYPGCSLEGMAVDYARSIDAVFQALDIDLVEIDDWSCCGATAAHSLSEAMSVILPARNLFAAEQMGLDIVSPCANCFNRLRFSQQMIQKNVLDIPWPVTGDLKVHDMTRFLAEPTMISQIKKRVLKTLKGLKLVCYYGCQMVRPPRITGYTDYENPQTLDRIAAATGAQVIDWSYKATCCGASIGIARREIGDSLTKRLLDKARQTGAEAIVVSCPLCQSNLDMIQKDRRERPIPIFYFTELLRLSFSYSGNPKCFKTHFANPVRLLKTKSLL